MAVIEPSAADAEHHLRQVLGRLAADHLAGHLGVELAEVAAALEGPRLSVVGDRAAHVRAQRAEGDDVAVGAHAAGTLRPIFSIAHGDDASGYWNATGSFTFRPDTLPMALRGYGSVVRPASAAGAASAMPGMATAAAPAAVAPDTLKNMRRETVESMVSSLMA